MTTAQKSKQLTQRDIDAITAELNSMNEAIAQSEAETARKRSEREKVQQTLDKTKQMLKVQEREAATSQAERDFRMMADEHNQLILNSYSEAAKIHTLSQQARSMAFSAGLQFIGETSLPLMHLICYVLGSQQVTVLSIGQAVQHPELMTDELYQQLQAVVKG